MLAALSSCTLGLLELTVYDSMLTEMLTGCSIPSFFNCNYKQN